MLRNSQIIQEENKTWNQRHEKNKSLNLMTVTNASSGAATPATIDDIIYVTVCTTGNIALDGSVTSIDGITVTTGNLILVQSQTDAKENGIYTYNSTGLIRYSFNIGQCIIIINGSTLKNTIWLNTNTSLNFGTDNITFVKFGTLPAGTDTQTLRYNGTSLVASSNLENDGTNVSINHDLIAYGIYGRFHVYEDTNQYAIFISQDHATAGSMIIKNERAGDGLFIDQDGTGTPLHIYTLGSTINAIYVSGGHTGNYQTTIFSVGAYDGRINSEFLQGLTESILGADSNGLIKISKTNWFKYYDFGDDGAATGVALHTQIIPPASYNPAYLPYNGYYEVDFYAQVLETDSITLIQSNLTASQTVTAIGNCNVYDFTVTSGNASAGSTYSHNGQTYMVLQSITSYNTTTLICQATGTPLSSGTLTKVSGTGDASLTFSAATLETAREGFRSVTFTGVAIPDQDRVKGNSVSWNGILYVNAANAYRVLNFNILMPNGAWKRILNGHAYCRYIGETMP